MNILRSARAYAAAVILVTVPAAAMAKPLKIVNVGAPAINCVFNPKCTLAIRDVAGNFTLPGGKGTAFLQSRTFASEPDTPAAGKQGILYRVDVRNVVATGTIPCVSSLKLDFGPVTKLPYAIGGPAADMYVITKGGIGSIGVASAEATSNLITVTFAKPICAGSSPGKGESSYFFGLTGVGKPTDAAANMQVAHGPFYHVAALVPKH